MSTNIILSKSSCFIISNNDKVAKSGDTMTGALTMYTSNPSITFKRSTNDRVKYLDGGSFTNSTTNISLPDSNGTLATREWVGGVSIGSGTDDGFTQVNSAMTGVRLFKQGRMVTLQLSSADAYTFSNATLVLTDAYDSWRPDKTVSGLCIVYKSDTSCYIGTIDFMHTGYMKASFYNTISTRGTIGNTGHYLYGVMSWYSKG